MRKVIFVLLILLFFIPTTSLAQEEPQENIDMGKLVDDLMEEVDIQDLEHIIGNINGEVGEFLPNINIKDFISSIVKGEFNLNFKELIKGIGKYLLNEVINNSALLSRIILLSIICAILKNLQSSFGSSAVGEIAFNVVYMVILAMAIQSFSVAMQIGIDAIDNMVTFIQALLPTLLTLLMSMGSITSAALFQPLITFTVSILSTFVKNIILPLIFFGGILDLVNYISEQIHISKLSGLLKQAAVGLLGFTMTIFVGVLAIQGVTSSSFDGVTTRTAKYAVDNFIPVIGGFLSDAVDTVIGCSLLIKNAIGVVGIISLFIIMIFPVIKILTVILLYKISSAIIEPIVDGRIVNSLNDISKSLTLVLVCVLAVGIMFFLIITIIIGTGSAVVMMR